MSDNIIRQIMEKKKRLAEEREARDAMAAEREAMTARAAEATRAAKENRASLGIDEIKKRLA